MNLSIPPSSGRLAAVLGVLAASLPLAPPAAGAGSSAVERAALAKTREAIVDCTNQERAEHGLPALRQSRPLGRAAQYHAENMLRHRFFAHKDTSGRDPAERVAMFAKQSRFHYIGENIAAGYRTGRGACHSWLVSSKHRHNILDPDYRWIGVGFARGDGGYGSYFVQNFGG